MEQSGVWSLDCDTPSWLSARETGRSVVLVPSEHLLILSAHLPLASARQRREALPYAIEEQVSEPVDSLHLALGDALEGEHHLAAVVDHARMRQWCARLEEAGLTDAMLVPDALALPLPAEGHWSTYRMSDRILVRLPDGTGFAAPAGRLEWLRTLAGMPVLDACALDLDGPLLDLRQGGYAQRRLRRKATWHPFALVAAAGLAIHAGIACADIFVLRHLAARHKAETETLVSIAMPGAYLGDNLVETASALAGGEGQGRKLLPHLSRASATLMPMQVQFDGIEYREGQLMLDLTDKSQLARARQALRGSGEIEVR